MISPGVRRSLAAPPLVRAVALVTLSILALSCHSCVHASSSKSAELAHVRRWWILIGNSPMLDGVDWRQAARDTQMIVLGSDPQVPPAQLPSETLRLGYLSVGEADPRRPYWGEVRAAPFLVEPDPAWPENIRVDVRDQRWQQILIGEEIPRLLAQGFDGLMLDTIDTAPYLEGKDPMRFAGSRRALGELVKTIRDRFPTAPVLANGIAGLRDVAPFVDGFVVEGVFATYDFGRRLYRETTTVERDWKLARIAEARAIARRPVFTIDYADVGDVVLAHWAESEAAERGFKPYVGVRELNTLP